MKLIVDGLAVEVYQEGKGRPVLMLHGWMSDASTFTELSQALSSKYRVLRVDLPGFGQSELPPANWNLDDYVDFAAKLLKKLDIKKLHAMIGHSLGGRIAIKAVAMRKLQPKFLALIGSHGIKESNSFTNRLFWVVAKLGKIIFLPFPSKLKNRLKRKLYLTAGSIDYLESGQMRNIYTNIIREDLRKSAVRIKVPTLLIYGADDTETPLNFGAVFNGLISGSRLEVIPSAGHYVHQEEAQRVNQLVLEFINA